jgi:hypothetical protein
MATGVVAKVFGPVIAGAFAMRDQLVKQQLSVLFSDSTTTKPSSQVPSSHALFWSLE